MKKFIVILAAALCLSGCNYEKKNDVFDQANPSYFYGNIMETENGYYYNKTDTDSDFAIYFHDKATGKDIILCNKPECLHDKEKSPFCAAVGEGNICCTALYENYLYTVRQQSNDGVVSMKLYRTALDGTEHTETATICKQKDAGAAWMIIPFHYMAIYRDKAYLQYQTRGESSWTSVGLACVDLKTGAVKKLCDEELIKNSYGCQKLIPYDDSLYFIRSNAFGKERGLFRYDLNSGKTEEIEIAGNFRDYCVVGGNIVFLRYDEDGEGRLYSLDPKIREEKRLSEAIKNKNGGNLFLAGTFGGYVLYDGEYLFVFCDSQSQSNDEVCVFSETGELLGRIEGPEYDAESWHDDKNFGGEIDVINGKVYYTNWFETVYCPIADILAGNTHWERAYEIHGKDDYYRINNIAGEN